MLEIVLSLLLFQKDFLAFVVFLVVNGVPESLLGFFRLSLSVCLRSSGEERLRAAEAIFSVIP